MQLSAGHTHPCSKHLGRWRPLLCASCAHTPPPRVWQRTLVSTPAGPPPSDWPACPRVSLDVPVAHLAGLGGMGLPGLDDLGDGGAALRGVPGVGGMDMGGMMQVRQCMGCTCSWGRAGAWHAACLGMSRGG